MTDLPIAEKLTRALLLLPVRTLILNADTGEQGPQSVELPLELRNQLVEALAIIEALLEALEQIARETGKGADGYTDWQRALDRVQNFARAAINLARGVK